AISNKPKKAAQYGSNFDKAIEILAKKNNFFSKAQYLKNFFENESVEVKNLTKNIPIGALISTGKDSLFALYLMQKQGYDVKCLITIDSKNKDSYMFHTPTISLAKLQSKAIGIPLIIAKTNGQKEIELADLQKAIKIGVNKFGIEGVCSGALYSNYQRERIEHICENLGIRSFSPLWHMNQLAYLKHLISARFGVIITKIAAKGLDEKWLGRIIDLNAIDELAVLETKLGINPAGEGGEYESLVIDAPIFRKKIEVLLEKNMQNEFNGEIIVKSAKLVNK
ncbi:MAG: diphthine--ammonia ligase, partial [archaeon]